MRRATVRGLWSVAAGLMLVFGVLVVAPAPSTAGPGDPPGITDYATYPEQTVPAIFPEGCEAEGGVVVVGEQYTATAVGGAVIGPVSDMRDLGNLSPGTTIDMSWGQFAPGCEGAGISLAVKRADQPTFDPNTNQELIDAAYDYCGPQGIACAVGADDRFHLIVVMPSRRLACNYQVDAVVGPPLAVVGPAGSYYSTTARVENDKPGGRTTLIGANNGGAGEDCGSAQPVAEAALDCSVGGVVLSLFNRGDLEATFEITVTGGGAPAVETFDIPGDGEAASAVTREVLVPEGATRTMSVTADGVEIMNQSFTRDCAHPAATIAHSCDADAAIVDLANTGETDAEVVVTFDDGVDDAAAVVANAVIADTVTIPAATQAGPGTAQRSFPLVEGGEYTLVVTDPTNGDEILAFESWIQDCEVEESLRATITAECVEDTNSAVVSVHVVNDGEADALIAVTKNGTVVDSFTLAPGTDASREYEHVPGVPATFAVIGPTTELASTELAVSCVSPNVIERPQTPPAAQAAPMSPPASPPASLPRTGASRVPQLTTFGGSLLLVGAALVALNRRRQQLD
jgi:LPXTG-motif cell wall-anchored protein